MTFYWIQITGNAYLAKFSLFVKFVTFSNAFVRHKPYKSEPYTNLIQASEHEVMRIIHGSQFRGVRKAPFL